MAEGNGASNKKQILWQIVREITSFFNSLHLKNHLPVTSHIAQSIKANLGNYKEKLFTSIKIRQKGLLFIESD
ncbi:CLUMA_CG002428, isoform A [Clunio marinus]|uniref:CLUMA_CG002428, isoform A n=1 Tax=Clunio marinus TaxID=568069 RepID=A0A1J1HQT0_9DIPT|nr:CLUMA_CG002428, isoform A [Clunio marinus]